MLDNNTFSNSSDSDTPDDAVTGKEIGPSVPEDQILSRVTQLVALRADRTVEEVLLHFREEAAVIAREALRLSTVEGLDAQKAAEQAEQRYYAGQLGAN